MNYPGTWAATLLTAGRRHGTQNIRWTLLMRLLLAFLLFCGFSQAHALVIGVYELSPHMVAEGQKEPSGAVVEFAREVFGRNGEFGPWNGAVPTSPAACAS